MNEEIQLLQQALDASPENTQLKRLLVQKMKLAEGYSKEIILHTKELLRLFPSDRSLKETLIEEYYKIENYSACIVLADTIKDVNSLSSNARLALAKSYLEENNYERAEELYKTIVSENPDHKDERLDKAFRVSANVNDELIDDTDYLLKKPDISFKDVGGMEKIKKEIDLKIIKPLANAEMYAKYGKKVGGGILLYGPPGCGKTFIAKATAGEIDAKFINIGLNDILDMWIGNSEKNLHEYFELARENTPVVYFSMKLMPWVESVRDTVVPVVETSLISFYRNWMELSPTMMEF